MLLVTKSRFSQYFGQKSAFLVTPTHVLQTIAKEWKEVQTIFFSDDKGKSGVSFGMFFVDTDIELNFLWVLKKH